MPFPSLALRVRTGCLEVKIPKLLFHATRGMHCGIAHNNTEYTTYDTGMIQQSAKVIYTVGNATGVYD